MKGIAKAILVGGFMLAAQAAVADSSALPGAADDAGVRLPANVTFASQHANDSVTSADSAFAGAARDGIYLPANITYASQHANDPVMSAAAAFPGSDDDAGVRLPARSTYANSHLDKPVHYSQPAQDLDTGGN